MPGFARVGDAASFSNVRGIERACALEIGVIKSDEIDIQLISFRINNLIYSSLSKSSLGNGGT